MSEGGVTGLGRLPVGPALVAALAMLGPVRRRDRDAAGVREVLPDAAEQVLVAQLWQRVIAWAESCLDTAVLQIAGARVGPEEEDWGREEIAAGLRWSGLAASDRIAVARVLAGRCFLTRRALEEGRISYRHAVEIVHALEPLDDETAAEVEAGLLGAARSKTSAQLARKARRDVAKADPKGAEERHKRARRGRRVEFAPLPDGMALVQAFLPADDAVRVRAVVEEWSGRMRSGGDTRTLDQRRADALVALAEAGGLVAGALRATDAASGGTSGAGAAGGAADHGGAAGDGGVTGRGGLGSRGGAGGSGGVVVDGAVVERVRAVLGGKRAVPARVAVTVPLSTLLGATELPGELTGFGPVPACVARELAGDGKWEKWVTDERGVVTDLGRSTYRPSAALAALVRAAYPRCVFPSCSQPSYRCDLDHNVRRIDGGPTSAANLLPLCRRHHRAKDEAGWQVVHHPVTGVCSWTSPAGQTYTVEPPEQGEVPGARGVAHRGDDPAPGPARGASARPAGPRGTHPAVGPARDERALVGVGAEDPPPF